MSLFDDVDNEELPTDAQILYEDYDDNQEFILHGGKNDTTSSGTGKDNNDDAKKDSVLARYNYDEVLKQLEDPSLSEEKRRALERRKQQIESHQQYMQQMQSAQYRSKNKSTIAGAGTHSEKEYMRLRVQDDERQRRLDAEEAKKAESQQKIAAINTAKAKLEAERNKKAEKRKAKKAKAKNSSSGAAGKSEPGSALGDTTGGVPPRVAKEKVGEEDNDDDSQEDDQAEQ